MDCATSVLSTTGSGITLAVTPSDSTVITSTNSLRYSENERWKKYDAKELRPGFDQWKSDDPTHYLPPTFIRAIERICSSYSCTCLVATQILTIDSFRLRYYVLHLEGAEEHSAKPIQNLLGDLLAVSG